MYYMQFRLSLHKPLNIGIYRLMLRTRGTSSSSTPLGKKVCTSRCSFYIFLYSLDKGYHLMTMTFPDSRSYVTMNVIYIAYKDNTK